MSIWVFPKIGAPQNGWFILENPIKMDDSGVPLFLETPIYQCKTVRRLLYHDLFRLLPQPDLQYLPHQNLDLPRRKVARQRANCHLKPLVCLLIYIVYIFIYTYIYINIQVHTSFDVKVKNGRYIVCICI